MREDGAVGRPHRPADDRTPSDRTPSARTRRPRTRRPAGLHLLATAYGLASTGLLVAVAVVGDGSALTYAAALGVFWWVLPALGLVPVAVVGRRWGTLASLLVPAVVAGALTGPYLLPGRGDGEVVGRAESGADLRVAAFNTSGTRGLDALDALVRRDAPDVLLLQEIGPSTREALADRYPQYPHRSYGTAFQDSPGAAGSVARSGSDAVLSTVPLVSVEPVEGLPAGARPAEVVRLRTSQGEVAVVSLHLASPCLFCSRVEQEQNPAGGTASAARVRTAEARRFAELARALGADGTPVVLGGDLNSSDLNTPLGVLTGSGLVDVHRAVGTRPQLTRGSNPGYARVDVVLVRGLRPLADAERPAGGSDHSPVVADLAWP